jgi:hypothetical protein
MTAASGIGAVRYPLADEWPSPDSLRENHLELWLGLGQPCSLAIRRGRQDSA